MNEARKGNNSNNSKHLIAIRIHEKVKMFKHGRSKGGKCLQAKWKGMKQEMRKEDKEKKSE